MKTEDESNPAFVLLFYDFFFFLKKSFTGVGAGDPSPMASA